MGLVPSAGATVQKKRGRGASTSVGHGSDEVAAGRHSGWRGARERARMEELGRCSGWGRRVEARAAGGGTGEELAQR
jgi:hypothetical protein